MQFTNIIRTISLIGAFALAATTARAVTPAPDGGYPNGNTAEGTDALFNLNTSQGASNTAIGLDALFSLTTGSFNTATGAFALQSSTTGTNNTANGFLALQFSTTGSNNTAVGEAALTNNTTGDDNTATGHGALFNNTAATPIAGTFSNLADGSTFTVGTNTYLVSYEGGTGNDLTLTVQ